MATTLLLVILFIGSVVAINNPICLFYYDHFDTIQTEIRECNSTVGSVEHFESKLKYFQVDYYNNPTPQWEKNITNNVHHVIYKTKSSLLVAVENEKENSFIINLPLKTNIYHISPFPSQSKVSQNKVLNEILKKALAPNPLIQNLVAQVNAGDLRYFVEYLTGESAESSIRTRHSLSPGGQQASAWIFKQFEYYGFHTFVQCYRTGYSCNVIATRLGVIHPSEVVVVGGHFDSRASNLSNIEQRAPGANDDGSGTGTLLQIAKIIGESKIEFSRTVVLAAFSGEEQGLYGSQAYASELVSNQTNVIAMIQNDMIAYRAPSTGLLCGFPQRYTTQELTEIAMSASQLYSPTLSLGRNDRCCSDHRSFFERGFPATDFSDTHGPIVDPQYHSSGDLVNRVGFDFEKYVAIVKGIFATVSVLAEPQQ